MPLSLQVILQLLGTENLEGFTISRLCRCLKGTLFRSDDFMALICDKASKRMVDLVTAASREDTQASKKSFAEFAKLSSDILHTCATLDYHPPQSFFNILDNCVMWSVSRTSPQILVLLAVTTLFKRNMKNGLLCNGNDPRE
jgi:hypothetical protein